MFETVFASPQHALFSLEILLTQLAFYYVSANLLSSFCKFEEEGQCAAASTLDMLLFIKDFEKLCVNTNRAAWANDGPCVP